MDYISIKIHIGSEMKWEKCFAGSLYCLAGSKTV